MLREDPNRFTTWKSTTKLFNPAYYYVPIMRIVYLGARRLRFLIAAQPIPQSAHHWLEVLNFLLFFSGLLYLSAIGVRAHLRLEFLPISLPWVCHSFPSAIVPSSLFNAIRNEIVIQSTSTWNLPNMSNERILKLPPALSPTLELLSSNTSGALTKYSGLIFSCHP